MKRHLGKKSARKRAKKPIKRREAARKRAAPEQENLRVMWECCKAYNAHDVNRIAQMWDEAVVAESDTFPAPINGREAYRQFLQTYFNAFPDAHYDVEQMIASGDYVVTRARMTGTHRGEFRDYPGTNRRFEFHFCHIAQFKQGKIVRVWSYWDMGTLLRQLGLLQAGAAG